MSVVGRSPFEYLLNAPAGGGVASAFQEGEAAASRKATEASTRAESALRQREAGLRIGEFQAEAPLREAERQRMLSLYRDEGETPAARVPGSSFSVTAPGAAPQLPGTAGFIAGFESFSPTPYEDMTVRGGQRVSAGLRGGYGSDTVTLADGRVVPVTPGMTISEADAQRDLFRRIETEFQPRAVRAVGPTVWSSLPPQAHDALVSIAYNYGDVTRAAGVAEAAKSGDLERLAAAIEARAGDNGGINRQRRLAEAAHVRSAVPAQAAPQTQARPPVSLPAGALGEGFLRSPAGVPMTAPEADLPPAGPNAAPAQFMVPGPGGMQPVPALGVPAAPAPLPTTGLPVERAAAARAAEEATRQREAAVRSAQDAVYQSPEGQAAARLMEEGRLRNDRDMFMRGNAELTRLTEAMYSQLAGAGLPVPESRPGTPAAAATPTPVAGQMLGGATAIVPAGLSPAMGGGTPLGGAISPTSMAAQSQGLLTPRPTAGPAGAPAAAQPALPSTIPGLTVAGPAVLGLQQVQEQRAQLQRQYDRVRLAPPGERAALRAQIEAKNTELMQQERNYQVDIAVGQLSMGQWQPISSILQQTYGVQVRPVESGGQIAGYELVRGGRAVARLTPEQLGSQARLGLSQTFAQQEAARNKALYDANIEGIKEALKAKATAAAKIAEVEATARTRGFSQVQKLQDDSIVAFNPSTGEGFRYRQIPVPGGKKGETRDEIIQLRANVPVQ